MRSRFSLLTTVLCIGILASRLDASDVIFVNGRIYTGNNSQKWVQAIAITGSRIAALGTNEDVMKTRQANTRIINLKERTVIPGIIDSHTHMWFGALALHGFNLATEDVYIEGKDEAVLEREIKAYAASHPKDKILFGRVQFANDVNHAVLDRAVSDRPIVIHAPTEHTLWVNGKALAMAGISEKKIADPAIEKVFHASEYDLLLLKREFNFDVCNLFDTMWAARILGFYAKTPVFQGANEREIGLLLRLAGLKWVRGALRLKVDAPDPSDRDVKAILADVRPKVGVADKVELLADATLDDLGSRAMSQESRDVYHGVRDYIAAAARELAERELEAASHAVAFNTAAAEGDDFAASRKIGRAHV